MGKYLLMNRTVHTFGCFLKYLDISILDYPRDKTQKHTPAKPVPIRSSVELFVYVFCCAGVVSLFSARCCHPGCHFFLLIYVVFFIDLRKFALNSAVGAKGNLHRRASWRIVKFLCLGWYKHAQKFSKKWGGGQLTLLAPTSESGGLRPPPAPLFLRLCH